MQNNPALFVPAVSFVVARIDAWFYRHRQRALERYLASSQNVAELEARMRDLDRPVPHPYY